MKADKEYSSIDECPKTGTQMSHDDIYHTNGVCPHCGHECSYVSHHDKVVGRFVRPTIWERIIDGKRLEFIRKEDEDKIMERLSE